LQLFKLIGHLQPRHNPTPVATPLKFLNPSQCEALAHHLGAPSQRREIFSRVGLKKRLPSKCSSNFGGPMS
jgi:hypothetical protein